MKNQNPEIVPQKINEIESLNEIVELDLESLEAIVGGQKVNCPFLMPSCSCHSKDPC